MTEKVIVLHANGHVNTKDLKIVDGSMLDGLQEIVGGFIETVHPRRSNFWPDDWSEYCLVVNEEGLLKQLPFNRLASLFYGWLTHDNPIVGDAAICKIGFRRGEPDLIGLQNFDVDNILYYIEHIFPGAVIDG